VHVADVERADYLDRSFDLVGPDLNGVAAAAGEGDDVSERALGDQVTFAQDDDVVARLLDLIEAVRADQGGRGPVPVGA
jgi:hypothetical protein